LIKVAALNVVNVCAERYTKLCHDFISYIKSEDKLQNMIQVAEQDRKRINNQFIKKCS